MKKNRFDEIDFLRAIAIIGVVLIHTLVYYLNNSFYYLLWNYLHFVVTLFVFCSGYVLFTHYQNYFKNTKAIFLWWKKRLIRLIKPFYLYLIIHYLLMIFFPNFFSGLGLKKELGFFIQSVTLIGGIDLNWLVLLFLELTLIFPILVYLTKKPFWFYLGIFLSIISSIWFLFQKPTNYRTIMWLPWASVLFLSVIFYFLDQKNLVFKKNLFFYSFLFILSLLIFFIFYLIKKPATMIFFNHKYPPDIIYLAYGLMALSLFVIISKLPIIKNLFLKKIYQPIGHYSYSIFFTHYLVIDFFKTRGVLGLKFLSQPLIFFFLVFSTSLGIVKIFSNLEKFN